MRLGVLYFVESERFRDKRSGRKIRIHDVADAIAVGTRIGVDNKRRVSEEAERLVAPVSQSDIVVANGLRGVDRDAGNLVVFANHDTRTGVFRRGFENRFH